MELILACGLLLQSACVSSEIRQDCTLTPSEDKLKVIKIQIARNEKERSRGLMYKKDMGNDEGMLFVFEGMDERSFWMKNTFIPLDMFFIDQEGVVKKIFKNVAPLTEIARKSDVPAMYVLELKAGGADAYAISEGSRLDLSACK